MKALTTWLGVTILFLSGLALAGCDDNPLAAEASVGADLPGVPAASGQPIAVSGSGVHYASRSIVHSQVPTASGMIQQSTEYVKLTGDLEGYVLFNPTSAFDFAAGTLVNTGRQVFSGTVAGSAPVLLHDDTFRFDVDLNTGATTGVVNLGRSKDWPAQNGWFECDLEVVGTGVTPEGDNLSDYSGTCTPRGNPNGVGS